MRFSPTAWAKLLYFRDKTENEVGGFGITEADDLLFVTDFITVKQKATCVSVRFDDQAVGRFFDDQVDLGRKPEQFARVWCHTHPDMSPGPSAIDEETFERVFGNCQWALMFVIGQKDDTYARLSFNVGPGGRVLIPAEVDYSRPFNPTDHEQWDAEYAANVEPDDLLSTGVGGQDPKSANERGASRLPYDFMEELEDMDPAQRQLLLDELAERPELWTEKIEEMLL